ncbi:MAG: lyase family protein [Nocardioidaceae bacterium]
MSALLWPGDDRAGDLMSDGALLASMVEVEQAWLAALVAAGIAPRSAQENLAALVDPNDLSSLASAAEGSGTPIPPLLALLRERVGNGEASRWLHKGLTSQDVIDTALVMTARAAVGAVRASLLGQVRTLRDLVAEHRGTPMVARTLTQHAVPTTFGLKAVGWLTGVLDALDDLRALVFPVQVGGAAGTLAALVELGDPALAVDCVAATARTLGLDEAAPWHTTRSRITRIGDAAVRCTDAWGHIANDVLALSRPEIAEVAEGVGGGSSTMPHKANPVLSTLVRRAALAAPGLGAALHLAAAEQVDERADGSWHVEWQTLATLLRRTVVAGAQTADLLGGLRVHTDRMAATLASAHDDVRAEQRTMAAVAGHPPRDDYLGLTQVLVDQVLTRAARIGEGASA